MAEPEISIHEDDEGMRNLYPLAAHKEAAADVQGAIDAGIRNKVPGGIGWTDVHMIKPPGTTFADAGLALAAATAALSPLMPRVRRFWSGLLGRNDPLAAQQADAYCFGFDATCFIKLEPKGELVERIWYEARTGDAAHMAVLRKALLAIDALSPALIADYWLDATGPVGEAAFLDVYFKALGDP
ncbi:MAG: hypothetical protein HOP13_05225 [Alphaproteobacteria bacterium]|nr:hypothetical protein [Alphaproteobacteria bacterium]